MKQFYVLDGQGEAIAATREEWDAFLSEKRVVAETRLRWSEVYVYTNFTASKRRLCLQLRSSFPKPHWRKAASERSKQRVARRHGLRPVQLGRLRGPLYRTDVMRSNEKQVRAWQPS